MAASSTWSSRPFSIKARDVRMVSRLAARQAAKWKADGYNLRIAINVSARQLADTAVVQHFTEALQCANLDPCLIDLELTESCLIEDEAAAIDLIKQFRQIGAQVHLDDFGTGYSSLSYLALTHPKIIKIDQSFVSPAVESLRNDALLEAIVMLGQKLDMTMLAEGIETSTQLERLQRLGCEFGQGFLFSPAVPAEEAGLLVGKSFAF